MCVTLRVLMFVFTVSVTLTLLLCAQSLKEKTTSECIYVFSGTRVRLVLFANTETSEGRILWEQCGKRILWISKLWYFPEHSPPFAVVVIKWKGVHISSSKTLLDQLGSGFKLFTPGFRK